MGKYGIKEGKQALERVAILASTQGSHMLSHFMYLVLVDSICVFQIDLDANSSNSLVL